jgi:hypothetical protein
VVVVSCEKRVRDEELVERVARRFEVAGVIVDSRIPALKAGDPSVQSSAQRRYADFSNIAEKNLQIFRNFERAHQRIVMRAQLITPLSLYRLRRRPYIALQGAQARAGKFFR